MEAFPRLFERIQLESLTETSVLCAGVCLGEMSAQDWCALAQGYTTDDEKVRAGRFTHVIDAARHLVGRMLIRVCLAKMYPNDGLWKTPFLENPWGKPFLADCRVEFSISHSGDMVWVAFSRSSPVGIDVEQQKTAVDIRDMESHFHPAEASVFSSVAKDQIVSTFYRGWVRKEAVVKALGKGLQIPLSSFQVSMDVRPTSWLKTFPEDTDNKWITQDLIVPPGYCCSIAVPEDRVSITACILN